MTDEALKIRLGQRLSVGFEGTVLPKEYVDLVKEYKVGNAVLFRRNVQSYAQLKALCAQLRDVIQSETGHVPFIMIDEECGSVSRLAHIAAPTPCAMAIGATDDARNAYRIGRLVGEELGAAGINFNFGPVLDCFTNPDNAVIGNRCFSTSPEKTAAMGVAYMKGLQETGVIACGKHFPGHGDTATDSHLALPIVEKSMDEMRKTELVSFTAAIREGLDAIMTAHVVFPALEPDRVPATVSRRVMTGLLREEMGFEGIIVSDGMEMKAVMDLFGIEEASRRALAAGVDIALVCHSPAQGASISRYLRAAVEKGDFSLDEAESHYQRIARRKALLPAPTGDPARFGSEVQRALARKIMNQSIRLLHAPQDRPLPQLNEDTLFFGVPARASSFANDDIPLDGPALCAAAFGAKSAGVSPNAAAPTAVALLSRHEDLPALQAAVTRMANSGTQVIAVSLSTSRCLDALPDSVWKIGAWQYDELSLNALIQFLKG